MVRGMEMGQEREGPGVGVGGEGVSRMEQSRRQALSPGHLVPITEILRGLLTHSNEAHKIATLQEGHF